MGLLERSDEIALLADRLAGVRRDGAGRVVLVGAEAGGGKSALVRTFMDGLQRAPVLVGACEALFTPRPLGPWIDIANEAGGIAAATVAESPTPADLLDALTRMVREPTVVVLEDLHWADEASLDVLRLLIRRIGRIKALVIGTYRDDELSIDHPLRVVLGEALSPEVERIALHGLSRDAVAMLLDGSARLAADVHARTGGNPFYVTELIAARDGLTVPGTVRDAVLARAARLSPAARRLLEAVAVSRPRAELELLEAIAPDDLPELQRCLDAGVLRPSGAGVEFRHEIARVTIEEAMPVDRRVALHRASLGALSETADPARLAHHAEAAGDVTATIEHATIAAERASALGAHREAASQLRRALRHRDRIPAAERARLLHECAKECYLTDALEDALAAIRDAISTYRELGDQLREGAAESWHARLRWYLGESDAADGAARRALELLEALPPGRELAQAYMGFAGLQMLQSNHDAAITWGRRALELAESLGDQRIVAGALNNIGSARVNHGDERGWEDLRRALAAALEADAHDEAARAHVNTMAPAVVCRDMRRATSELDRCEEYCREQNVDTQLWYTTGFRARHQLDAGSWDEAAATAHRVLAQPRVPGPTRVAPLVVLGLLRGRRGDPDPWPPLDEARDIARRTGELQRLAPVGIARAELHLLAGHVVGVDAETGELLADTIERSMPWWVGELCVWRRRAGLQLPEVDVLPPGHALELAGDLRAASAWWDERGCPYDAAQALAWSDDEDDLRAANDRLQALDARVPAAIVARRLRERGARDVRRGPRARTRANPAGLTPRQLDVLALVAEGRRNADIAARLFLSEKTVAHHVSAILHKLDVETRGEAAAAAARLGILER